MQKLVINGGNRLMGSIEISGAKNAALPLLACGLLADEPLILSNIPDLADIKTIRSLLEQHGVQVVDIDENTLELDGSQVNNLTAPYELVRTMRASILVLGPLLARHGAAKVSLPGGCAIGSRPVDMHLRALEKMGAVIELVDGYVHAHVDGRLQGAVIDFDKVSVGATENTLMAASLAKGTTIINNAAREPEVCDLANCLVSMGAKIEGIGTSQITIEGVDRLHKASHRVVADRIEAGSFACAAAITRGRVELVGARAEHMGAILDKFTEAGVVISETKDGILVNARGELRAVDITTEPYPDFPTDMQAQFMAMLSLASGSSTISETIFENRFMHVSELARMGANIHVNGNTATVTGTDKLKGAEVMATDLRASLSLVIAALAAEGESTVHRLYHLDRGYEKLVRKLRGIGADISRVDADAPATEKVVALKEVV